MPLCFLENREKSNPLADNIELPAVTMRVLVLFLFSIHLCSGQSGALKLPKPLKIGSFNIQKLGDAKVGRPEVVRILVQVHYHKVSKISAETSLTFFQILDDYDIVAIQEIVDKNEDAFKKLMKELNNHTGNEYNFTMSKRVGRSPRYEEQHAFIYR